MVPHVSLLLRYGGVRYNRNPEVRHQHLWEDTGFALA